MKRYENVVHVISNYSTHALPDDLETMGELGFRLVSTEMAKNKYGVIVMYLFFVKKIDEVGVEI